MSPKLWYAKRSYLNTCQALLSITIHHFAKGIFGYGTGYSMMFISGSPSYFLPITLCLYPTCQSISFFYTVRHRFEYRPHLPQSLITLLFYPSANLRSLALLTRPYKWTAWISVVVTLSWACASGQVVEVPTRQAWCVLAPSKPHLRT